MRNSKTPLDRDLRCASQITNLDVIWRTHGPKYLISNRDSRCASRITIQNTHFAVVWKQSKIRYHYWTSPLKGMYNWFHTCPWRQSIINSSSLLDLSNSNHSRIWVTLQEPLPVISNKPRLVHTDNSRWDWSQIVCYLTDLALTTPCAVHSQQNQSNLV